MSIAIEARYDGSVAAQHATEVRLVKPLQFVDRTPQTPGMHRLAAISHLLAGSESLWAGIMLAEPNTASSVHHHGPLETVVYVLSGKSRVRSGSRLEHAVDLEPGDFLLIPPYMPHQEINPSPNESTIWVVVRSGQEAVIVHLARNRHGEYVAVDADPNQI